MLRLLPTIVALITHHSRGNYNVLMFGDVLERGSSGSEGKGKLGAYAMKRVTAGALFPTPWLFELFEP